jgi:hypothetical protein
MEKITEFLVSEIFNRVDCDDENYEGDLWQKISYFGSELCRCADVTCNIIDSDDNYSVDFSGKQKMFELFFTGSDDFFPAIWFDENDLDNIEKYPIYIIDCSDYEIETEPIGNFRYYIEKILDDFIRDYDKDDIYLQMAKEGKQKLDQFSREMINKGNYKLKRNFE